MSDFEHDADAGKRLSSRRWFLRAMLVAPLVVAPAIEAAAQEFSDNEQGFLRELGRGLNRGARNLGLGGRPARARRPARTSARPAQRRSAAPKRSGGGKSAPKFAD